MLKLNFYRYYYSYQKMIILTIYLKLMFFPGCFRFSYQKQMFGRISG